MNNFYLFKNSLDTSTLVSFEEGIAQAAAEREPQSTQDGFWRSDWSLVPRQDAAVPARGCAFREGVAQGFVQTGSSAAVGRVAHAW